MCGHLLSKLGSDVVEISQAIEGTTCYNLTQITKADIDIADNDEFLNPILQRLPCDASEVEDLRPGLLVSVWLLERNFFRDAVQLERQDTFGST